MGLLQNLIDLMTPDVVIEVGRDQFTFRCQDRGESVEPVLWISGEGRRARVSESGRLLRVHNQPVEVTRLRDGRTVSCIPIARNVVGKEC